MRNLLLICLSVLFCFNVTAEDLNVAIVNPAKILATSKLSIATGDAIRTKFTNKRKALEKMRNELLVEKSQLEKLINSSTSFAQLSNKDQYSFKLLSAKYQKDSTSFQHEYSLFTNKVDYTQNFATTMLIKQIDKIIASLSKVNNYSLVFTTKELAFAKDKFDITPLVIQQLDKLNVKEFIQPIASLKLPDGQSFNKLTK